MTKQTVVPLFDKVLIRLGKQTKEKISASGIILPNSTEKEHSFQGLVVAVGEGRCTDEGVRIKPTLKKGDVVLFTKFGGEEVKLDGVEHIIVREDQVLAIIRD